MSKKKNKKDLHGNLAKIDPAKDVEGLYVTNSVTMSQRKIHETPVVEEENVEAARDFANENKK